MTSFRLFVRIVYLVVILKKMYVIGVSQAWRQAVNCASLKEGVTQENITSCFLFTWEKKKENRSRAYHFVLPCVFALISGECPKIFTQVGEGSFYFSFEHVPSLILPKGRDFCQDIVTRVDLSLSGVLCLACTYCDNSM